MTGALKQLPTAISGALRLLSEDLLRDKQMGVYTCETCTLNHLLLLFAKNY